MQPAHAVSNAPHARRLHPLPIRIMHWTNAVAMFIMIGSGWKIYEDEAIFGWLRFPDALTFGPYAQHGLQLHFFGMWILGLNGLAYVTYGLVTGRFRRMLLPIRMRDLIATIHAALRLRLAHDDPTQYNAIQRILYVGVLLTGVLIVLSGLAIWKPIQLSELLALFYDFQTARLIHFLCMTAIVLFVAVHVALAILVPHTLVAMVTGGPVVNAAPAPEPDPAPADAAPADAAPANAAPADAAPANAAPADAAPTDAAPTDAAPTDAAPANAMPSNAAQRSEQV